MSPGCVSPAACRARALTRSSSAVALARASARLLAATTDPGSCSWRYSLDLHYYIFVTASAMALLQPSAQLSRANESSETDRTSIELITLKRRSYKGFWECSAAAETVAGFIPPENKKKFASGNI
jgi:hypothetical protein